MASAAAHRQLFHALHQRHVESTAATRIQAVWRGYFVRSRMDEQLMAVVDSARRASLHVTASQTSSSARDSDLIDTAQAVAVVPAWRSADMRVRLTAMRLDALVAKICDPDFDDAATLQTFLLTHTNFMTSSALLAFLADRVTFAGAEADAVAARVSTVFSFWASAYAYDFEDGSLDSGVARLAATHGALADAADRVAAGVAGLEAAYEVTFDAFSKKGRAPKSILPNVPQISSVLDLDVREAARQITLIDHAFFFAIRPKELLHQAWAKRGRDVRAPNVLQFIERFNDLSRWAAAEILRPESLDDRVHSMCAVIDVAAECLALSNFNALMAILSALFSAAVSRLKRTMAALPDEYGERLQRLHAVMSVDHNYRAYRLALRQATPPCVPHIGKFLQDLTFIDDGNPDTVGPHALLNFEKHQMTANAIVPLLAFKGDEYCLQPVIVISEYITEVAFQFDENALYALSLEREPRGVGIGRRRTIVHRTRRRNSVAPDSPGASGSSASSEPRGVNPAFVQELIAHMTEEHYNAGEYVVRTGQDGACMYFIASGVVDVLLPNDVIVQLNQGDHFGEIALFFPLKRTASVVAHTNVKLLRLDKNVCDEVLAQHPEEQEEFLAVSRARYESTTGTLKKGSQQIAWLKAVVRPAEAEKEDTSQLSTDELGTKLDDLDHRINREQKTRRALQALQETYAEGTEARNQINLQVTRSTQLIRELCAEDERLEKQFKRREIVELRDEMTKIDRDIEVQRKTKSGIVTLLETYRDGSEAQRQVLNEIQTCDAKIYIAETMKKKTAARLARKIEAFRTEYNIQRKEKGKKKKGKSARAGAAGPSSTASASADVSDSGGEPVTLTEEESWAIVHRALKCFVWRYRIRKSMKVFLAERQHEIITAYRDHRLKAEAATRIQSVWRGARTRTRLASQGLPVVRMVFARGRGESGASAGGSVSPPASHGSGAPVWNPDVMVCQITAIRLDYLLDKVCEPGFDDDGLRSCFAATHSVVMDTTAVVEAMAAAVERTAAAEPERAQEAVAFVHRLVEDRFYFFHASPPLAALRAFLAAARAAVSSIGGDAVDAIEALAAAREEAYLSDAGTGGGTDYDPFSETMASAPRPVLPTRTELAAVMDIHPTEIARQLTLIDAPLIARISPKALIELQHLSAQRSDLTARDLVLARQQNAELRRVVTTEVVRQADLESQAYAYCHWVYVCLALNDLASFNALHAVYAGLTAPSIAVLKHMLGAVPDEVQRDFERVTALFAPATAYAAFWNAFEKVDPDAPRLYAVDIALAAVAEIESTAPTLIHPRSGLAAGAAGDSGGPPDDAPASGVELVNIDKLRSLARVAAAAEASQAHAGYALQPVFTISQYLFEGVERWSEDRLYATALANEQEEMGRSSSKRRGEVLYRPPPLPGTEDLAGQEDAVNPEFVARIMHRMKRVSLSKGTVIVKKGKSGNSMFFILRGVVSVLVGGGASAAAGGSGASSGPTGGIQLNQGAFFGEIALFLNKKRVASVVALTPVVLLQLRREVCDEVLEEFPEMRAQFRAIGLDRLRDTEGKKRSRVPRWMRVLADKM